MRLKRRTFLQRLSLALAALEIGDASASLLSLRSLPGIGHRYRALAQENSSRKLALLVGIDQYPASVTGRGSRAELSGCLTDVQLQRELLIHRFGFKAADILTLTNQKATRENIEEAFTEGLIKQARAGDLVVFHFSGYGSRLPHPNPETGESASSGPDYYNGLLPFDGILPTKGTPAANCLLEETLLLLLQSLPTERILAVLDTSYCPPDIQLSGGLRVRSRPTLPSGGSNSDELAFQRQLARRINTSMNASVMQRRAGQVPGAILAAAGPNQLATEVQWDGFSAGAFTYALTQYLWEASPATTLRISLNRTAGVVDQLVGREQQPYIKGERGTTHLSLSNYLATPLAAGADGAVTAVDADGKTATLWLAGLPASVLENYGMRSQLKLATESQDDVETKNVAGANKLDAKQHSTTPATPHSSATTTITSAGKGGEPSASASSTNASEKQGAAKPATTVENAKESSVAALQPKPKLQLQVRSRAGLSVRAKVCCGKDLSGYRLQTGDLVQEVVRGLPRNIGLTVLLDSSLERIERVDATSAFSDIPDISSVAPSGEHADYVFGKIPRSQLPAAEATTDTEIKTESPLENKEAVPSTRFASPTSYGIFSLGHELLPNTNGEPGEGVKLAVRRLLPTLRALLAIKLIRLTVNDGSSQLGVQASLEMLEPQKRVFDKRIASRKAPKPVAGILAPEATSGPEIGVPQVPSGSRIQCQIENDNDYPLYFMMLSWDRNGHAIALYSSTVLDSQVDTESPQNLAQVGIIPPNGSLTVPGGLTAAGWTVQGSLGITEIQLIFSCRPFSQTLALLAETDGNSRDALKMQALSNPLEVAQAILQDLDRASAAIAPPEDSTDTDEYALHVNAWATFSIPYQVV